MPTRNLAADFYKKTIQKAKKKPTKVNDLKETQLKKKII